jgi:hypothetical protein
MKKIVVTALLIASALGSFAQTPSYAEQRKAYLSAINKDIWQVFSESFVSFDLDKYMSIHAKDFIRVGGDRRSISNLQAYRDENDFFFRQMKERKNKVDIQFRFLERVANEEAASERGIYKTTQTAENGEKKVFYGKFHVIARFVQGSWKILVDYDSSEGNTIGQAAYDAAFAIDDLDRFVNWDKK